MTNKILAAVLVAASATLATSAFAAGYNVGPVTPAAQTAPTASVAQSNQPLTRADVRAQLVQIEQAGYRPGLGNDTNYPDDVQAAEARVNAQQADTSGFGSARQGTSEAGHRVAPTVSQ